MQYVAYLCYISTMFAVLAIAILYRTEATCLALFYSKHFMFATDRGTFN